MKSIHLNYFAGLLLILGVMGLPIVSSAQPLPNPWSTYNRLDGIDAGWVFTALQTPDATLWFGTDKGIARYDGAWQMLGEADGLPPGSVRALLLDDGGQLLAGTDHGIARRLDDGAWQSTGADIGPIHALAQLKSGERWAGGATGLYGWDESLGQWRKLDLCPLDQVVAMTKDDEQTLWLTDGQRLFRADANTCEVVAEISGDETPIITSLAPRALGGIWVGTNARGLYTLVDGALTPVEGGAALDGAAITSLHEQGDQTLWVGTNGQGVAVRHGDQWQWLTTADGLAADFVGAVFEDRDGILWFGTVAGISRYDERTWRLWSQADGAPTGVITSFATDGRGRLWAAVEDDGLYRLAGGDWQRVEPQANGAAMPLDRIETLFVAADGSLWLGTYGQGVFHLRGEAAERFTIKDGLASNFVSSIAQTPDGTLWFGTLDQGLSRFDGARWENVTPAEGLLSLRVQALHVDESGKLWVGTNNGVAAQQGEGWQRFGLQDGLASLDVRSIAEDNDGGLWFATWGNGVSRLIGDEWHTFTTSDGLLASAVETITVNPTNGDVWFGTVSGINVFDGRTWQGYGAESGMTLGRVHALAPQDDNGVFIGTDDGVIDYQPDQTPPTVQILAANNVPAQNGRVQLPPETPVRFALGGADIFTPADELYYMHRLEGYDDDWSVTRNPYASYPGLPEGNYRLEVIARDSAMNYSAPAQTELQIRRAPSTIFIPGLGEIASGLALLGVALATLLITISAYALWVTLGRQTMRRLAVERRFNPYIAGSPIRDEEMFFGRRSTLTDIETGIYHNSIMLHGERRIGKTSLLYQIKNRLETRPDSRYRFIPVLIDLEGTPETQFFHRLMEGLMDATANDLEVMPERDQLHYFREEPDAIYSDREFRRDLRDLLEYLNARTTKQTRIVFLLDEADTLNTYSTQTQQQFRRILQDAAAQDVRAIVAGISISKTWDRVESPWYNMFVEMALPPFTKQEAEQLIKEPVRGFYQWEEAAVHYVWTQSEGRPHRIQQIAMEAVNHMLDQKRRRITLQDARFGHEQTLRAEAV